MITLDPGMMMRMTDEHLLASLHGEHLTPCERELLKRWECGLITVDELRIANEKLELLLRIANEKLELLDGS